ncbi:Aldehyde dehydrogenase family 8 member A1 [Strongyloides ratti]|uniref:Aldehyde dehydrogenase family 8 member A1 n=1 Tax=Strongyloides ratti TaxID=34506 RepID=A0A090MZD0_STRRB|nr:Aldehyde dehydrogenase family 8 member A1 [Strongyloides ratti]CEF68719.1 Aldehyde dehydrogenase family 8 member A1 [Strongyloides ratti]
MANTKNAIQYLLSSNDNEPKKISNFINNQFIETNYYIDSINPATGKVWLKVPNSTSNDINNAANIGEEAFKIWKKIPIQKRCELLINVSNIIEDNFEEFAIIESRDQGKPISLAKAIDIPRAIYNFRFFASSIIGKTTTSTNNMLPVRSINYVKNDSIGIAGLISPWNLPLYLLTFKLAPALICGNCVICKPSEITSATAWLLCHTFIDAGFPSGVVNMIFGDGVNAGEALIRHPKIPIISFTGSTKIGKHINEVVAPMLKKISLEMGGKNSCIVFPSVDMDEVIPQIAKSCFINQGEICLCTERLFIHQDIYDEFIEKFVNETNKMTVGDPTENYTLGAIVSKMHFDKVMSYINDAKNDSSLHVLCGGQYKYEKGHKCENGYFIKPTIIAGAKDDSKYMKEEIFGPVVCVTKFSTIEEVIERANNTPYGLSASVWSKNSNELQIVGDELRVGTCWLNCWLVRDLNMPFGGTKESGIGREGAEDSIHFYTEQKTICLKF